MFEDGGQDPAIEATVFIPTFNGSPLVDDVIHAIRNQVFDKQYEILIIDSGSTDDTLRIIEWHARDDRRVRIHKIPNSEFQHGRTRNLAAQMARGKYVVFLTQDAAPSSNRWLEFLLEPFALSEQVKGVFGKQIPRLEADTTTRREVKSVFDSLGPDHSIMIHRSATRNEERSVEPSVGFYSDVNSAAPREFLLNEIPYEEVNYAEDQLFGCAVLEANHCKAYAPLAAVWHSNQYSIPDYFGRKVDEFAGMRAAFGNRPDPSIRKAVAAALRGTGEDLRFAARDREQPQRMRLRGALLSPVRNLLWSLAAAYVGRSREDGSERASLEKRQRSSKA